MGSKSIRNLIIALVIILIGIRIILFVFNSYLSQYSIAGSLSELIGAVEGMSTLLTYGLIVLIIIAIPFYLSKRSKEKEGRGEIREENKQESNRGA